MVVKLEAWKSVRSWQTTRSRVGSSGVCTVETRTCRTCEARGGVVAEAWAEV